MILFRFKALLSSKPTNDSSCIEIGYVKYPIFQVSPGQVGLGHGGSLQSLACGLAAATNHQSPALRPPPHIALPTCHPFIPTPTMCLTLCWDPGRRVKDSPLLRTPSPEWVTLSNYCITVEREGG